MNAGTVGLQRLISREESVADLLAYLTELDPEPLRRILRLRPGVLRVLREPLIRAEVDGEDMEGRLDLLIVNGSSHPKAILELKLGADKHGRQDDLYITWLRGRSASASAWWVTLEPGGHNVSNDWSELSLLRLFQAWGDSRDGFARFLSGSIVEELGSLIDQADGLLGSARSPLVADLLVKRWAAKLFATESYVSAVRTDKGAPMLKAYVPLPGYGARDVELYLDLRASKDPMDRPRRWLLRIGVDVEEIDERRPLDAAQALAHDLALHVANSLTRTALKGSRSLRGPSLRAVMAAEFDGFRRKRPEEDVLQKWRSRGADGRRRRLHPWLYHDLGLSIGTQFDVDAQALTSDDMVMLMQAVLTHLRGVSADVVAELARLEPASQ